MTCTTFKELFEKAFQWHTKTEYQIGDQVKVLGRKWECVKDHTSNVFGSDAIEHKVWKDIQND